MTVFAEFRAGLPFPPDRFQEDAMEAVAAGESVVVTAPTGSGKTLVAEAAVHLALGGGTRAFYTTPLKALSNQKFTDFRAIYGERRVGLLTGDNSINGGADVVVMTTEVLRNMIYADSAALDGLGVVVLDEVHYLQDRFRGIVWEEIIIHLPQSVPIVALSATISNARQFTDWVVARRGPTRLVVETNRPVPLESLYLLKDRQRDGSMVLAPISGGRSGRGGSGPARPNPQLERLLSQSSRRPGRLRTPRRYEVAELLEDEGLLPAIYFVFSRNGCEAAAEQVSGAGLRFTDAAEADEVRSVAAARTAHIAPAELAVLGYDRWIATLERGIAPHHAGMVPAFKEVVEELFRSGPVKLVFATETLSLGINMPARAVVLESLSKFTGEAHELLQPGDYTQLTGRAGRRGIDTSGTAIVLHSRFVPFDRVAAIATSGSHPLESSYRPTFNMAVNLIANYSRGRAEELLRASFGQFRLDQQRQGAAEAVGRLELDLREFRAAAGCDRGDLWEYLDRTGIAGARKATHGSVMRAFARELGAGDVLESGPDKRADRLVMLARGLGSNPRLLVLSAAGKLRRIRPEQLAAATVRIGTLALPEPFAPRETRYQREVVSSLRKFRASGEPTLAAYPVDGVEEGPEADPVASCPDLGEHLGWAQRARRAERELTRARRRHARGDSGLLAEFTALLSLLEDWGYTRGWTLTERGDRLRFLYNESDLLVAEAGSRGLFAGLDPAELAALVSVFVYDPRREVRATYWDTAALAERGEQLAEIAVRLAQATEARKLPPLPTVEGGFASLAYAWASGAPLDELLEDEDMAAGDFVRTCRQLIDLLVQIRDAFREHAAAAGAAAAALNRGVVAAGGGG